MSKTGSRAYIDINELKKEDQYKNSSSASKTKQNGSGIFRNYDTNSSLSKGSSNNTTPSKYSNLHSSLKKVQSVTHFQQNAKATTSKE